MILSILRYFFLAAVIYGYKSKIEDYLPKVSSYIYPIVTMTFLGMVFFISGLLNILIITVWAVNIIGIGLFVYYFIRNRVNLGKWLIKERCFLIIFGIGLLTLIFFWNVALAHYDNFSHWGLIVRYISKFNSLPNFETPKYIIFRDYITAESTWLYYVGKTVGVRENVWMVGQFLLNISAIFTIISLSKKHKYMAIISTFFISIIVLSINIRVCDLLVDTVIAILGAATIAITIKCRNNLRDAVICNFPIFAFLTGTKNSGIFFAVIGGVFLLFIVLIYKDNVIKMFSLGISSIFISVVGTWYLWKRHTKLVFPKGMHGKHQVSLGAYKLMLSSRTHEEVLQVKAAFLGKFEKVLPSILIPLGIIVLFAILFFIYNMIKRKRHIAIMHLIVAFLTVIMTIIYIFLVYMMYMVSMPIYEALRVSGLERYMLTLIVYLYLLLLAYALYLANYFTRPIHSVLVTIVSISLIIKSPIIVKDGLFHQFNMQPVEKMYLNLRDKIKDYSILDEDIIYYYTGNVGPSDYNLFRMKYEFMGNKVNEIIPGNNKTYPKYNSKGKNYIVIFKKDNTINKAISNFNVDCKEIVLN